MHILLNKQNYYCSLYYTVYYNIKKQSKTLCPEVTGPEVAMSRDERSRSSRVPKRPAPPSLHFSEPAPSFLINIISGRLELHIALCYTLPLAYIQYAYPALRIMYPYI